MDSTFFFAQTHPNKNEEQSCIFGELDYNLDKKFFSNFVRHYKPLHS